MLTLETVWPTFTQRYQRVGKEIKRDEKKEKERRRCIKREEDISATLFAAVVLPTAGGNSLQFCVFNVGDSLTYVYSRYQRN